MLSEDSVPAVLRASDGDREHVLEILRRGSAEGRLSYETFLRRVDLALHARRVEELAGLLSDLPSPGHLPSPGRGSEHLVRVVRWLSVFSARVQQAWRTPRLPRLVLPRDDRAYLIGRSPDCDLVLGDQTVSWRHAELRRSESGWLLVDLGSTNGTHLNGWQVGTGLTVVPGDWVRFGATRFRVTV